MIRGTSYHPNFPRCNAQEVSYDLVLPNPRAGDAWNLSHVWVNNFPRPLEGFLGIACHSLAFQLKDTV
jgi:hypothetical protein